MPWNQNKHIERHTHKCYHWIITLDKQNQINEIEYKIYIQNYLELTYSFFLFLSYKRSDQKVSRVKVKHFQTFKFIILMKTCS